MYCQKLEDCYDQIQVNIGDIPKDSFNSLIVELAMWNNYRLPECFYDKISNYSQKAELFFEIMKNNSIFSIEYCYVCDDNECVSYFPEKKCELCSSKIEEHDEYFTLFCITDEIRMSIKSYNSDFLNQTLSMQSINVLTQLRTKLPNLVPFIGSGISAPVGLPTWREIIDDISKSLEKSSRGTIEYYLDRNDYLSCFEIIFEDTSNQLYKNINDIKSHFFSKFGVDLPDDAISNHRNIIDLGSQLILTTNYDLLLEKSDKKNLYESHILSELEDQASLKRDKSILHLHGVAKNSKKNTMVVDKNDYEKIYGDDKIKRKLQSILGDKAILFLGYSLDDYYFMEELMDICESNNNFVDYYAIMINADLNSLKSKLKYYDNVKIIPLDIQTEDIKKNEDGYTKKIKRDSRSISEEIVKKIEFILKYIKNDLYI
ncbi:SIR2 family protein [Enterococcus sp. BWR-S5]|uniref:SIR2 family protein n=1 Tax=Enterococcus sp. BWR-S5 TaxID=2787714 RepID=UPI0019227505|nr:SIR2 family protein [Enterococcus sp. BWR-S5]MBL1225549.1 SIR2 family protein [Enterococcus sp. BWR-S5]